MEEDNFDCKLQALTDLLIALWSVGSRCPLSLPVFVCSVIVVCRYLCTCLWSLCRRRFLRCAKRCHSCESCCRRLLLRSRWILIGVLQRSFRWKIFAGEDFQPLVVLLSCLICMENCPWFTDRKHSFTNDKWTHQPFINTTWKCALVMLPRNKKAPWRHTIVWRRLRAFAARCDPSAVYALGAKPRFARN